MLRGRYSPFDLATLNKKFDHGLLLGLTDDDHPHYVLADGTRDFTGVVVGVDPTTGAHLATKEYVDDAIGTTLDYHFNNTASDINQETETTYNMVTTIEAGEETLSKAGITNAPNQLLFVFATLSGKPGGINLAHGVYDAHMHLAITGGGARSVDVYWKLSSINDDGTNKVLLMTSETLSGVSGSETEYTVHATLDADVEIDSASRLLIEFFGSGNSGNNATMVFHVEGNTGTHLTIKAPSTIFNTIYLRLDGTVAMSGALDMGTNAINNAGAITATGDVKVINDGASGLHLVGKTLGGPPGEDKTGYVAFGSNEATIVGYLHATSADSIDFRSTVPTRAGDTGTIRFFPSTGVVSFASGAFDIDSSGNITNVGNITSDGLIISSTIRAGGGNFQVNATGGVAIGESGSAANRWFDIDGSISGAGEMFGLVVTPSAGRSDVAATGGVFRIDIDASITGIDPAIALEIQGAGMGGGAAIVNEIGFNIRDITAGTTSNYAIKTGAGLIEFGDDVAITSHLLTLGNTGADTDIIISFLGQTNSADLTYEPDVDRFDFADAAILTTGVLTAGVTELSRLGVGVTPDGFLAEFYSEAAGGVYPVALTSSATIPLPGFVGRSSRGTKASPTQTLEDDFLFAAGGRGHTGSAFVTASQAFISFHAAEDVTAAAQGAYMRFTLKDIGTTVNRIRMVLDDDGLRINSLAGGVTKALTIGPPTPADDEGSYMEFAVSEVAGYGPQISGVRENPGSGGRGSLRFLTGTNSQVERMKITDAGVVTIGGTTHYTQFTDGIQTLHGNARVKRSLWIPAGAMLPPTGATGAVLTYSGIINFWAFFNIASLASTHRICLYIQPPLDMDTSVAPVLELFWQTSVTSADCYWQVEYLYGALDEDMSGAIDGVVRSAETSSGTAGGLVKSSFALPAPGGSDLILAIQITRRSDDDLDTINADVALHGAYLHFTSNKLGTPL